MSFYFSGKFIDRFGSLQILIVGNLYSRIINVIALIMSSIFSPVLMSTNALFFGASTVSMNTLLQKEFTSHQRATMGSLNSFGGSLFFAFFAVLFGGLADKIGIIPAFLVSQLFQLLPLWLYIKLFQYSRNSP